MCVSFSGCLPASACFPFKVYKVLAALSCQSRCLFIFSLMLLIRSHNLPGAFPLPSSNFTAPVDLTFTYVLMGEVGPGRSSGHGALHLKNMVLEPRLDVLRPKSCRWPCQSQSHAPPLSLHARTLTRLKVWDWDRLGPVGLTEMGTGGPGARILPAHRQRAALSYLPTPFGTSTPACPNALLSQGCIAF